MLVCSEKAVFQMIDSFSASELPSGTVKAAKAPPHNLEAEQSTLGSMLLDSAACEQAAEILQPEDFYRHAHRIIFETLLLLIEKDEAIDPITVCEELRSSEKLEQAGGRDYVISLTDFVPSSANIRFYAEIVQEKAILRKLLEAAHDIQGLGYSEAEDVSSLLDQAEQIVFRVGQRRVGDSFHALPPLLNDAWDRIEALYGSAGKTTGVPTGFEHLDYMTSGLQPSDLVIVAARPSMGKTALALNMAVHGALNTKQPVAIFSLEMSKEQLVQRILCTEARVNGHYLRTGNLRDGDWDRIAQASTRLQEAPIYIDDSPECSAMAMRAKCRRLRSEHGLGLIVVDYLQLMRWHRTTENRNQEISEIARSLKSLA
ncbi:MAG: replicative DNA helicase, partial [Armatimonadetes bacterium]|nr:replicative DNA helicase [Armatimonadota bacterium]